MPYWYYHSFVGMVVRTPDVPRRPNRHTGDMDVVRSSDERSVLCYSRCCLFFWCWRWSAAAGLFRPRLRLLEFLSLCLDCRDLGGSLAFRCSLGERSASSSPVTILLRGSGATALGCGSRGLMDSRR